MKRNVLFLIIVTGLLFSFYLAPVYGQTVVRSWYFSWTASFYAGPDLGRLEAVRADIHAGDTYLGITGEIETVGARYPFTGSGFLSNIDDYFFCVGHTAMQKIIMRVWLNGYTEAEIYDYAGNLLGEGELY